MDTSQYKLPAFSIVIYPIDMSYNLLAFFMGLFGSIHCTLMCGPLLFALQQNQSLSLGVAINKVLYQIGRILTYGVIGLVFGL